MDVERISVEKKMKVMIDSGRETFNREEIIALYEELRRKFYHEPDFVKERLSSD